MVDHKTIPVPRFQEIWYLYASHSTNRNFDVLMEEKRLCDSTVTCLPIAGQTHTTVGQRECPDVPAAMPKQDESDDLARSKDC